MNTFSRVPDLVKDARRCIEQGLWLDEHVPSVRRLAGQWGVSNTTANRVLWKLAKQGVIHKDRAGGKYKITRPPGTPIRSRPTRFSSRSAELANTLRVGILRGTYPFVAGTVLSMEDLCARFHSSRKTVASALARVANSSDLLEKTGRKYRISLRNKRHSGSDLIMMVRRKDMSSPLMMRLIQAAESRCNAIGWNRLSVCFRETDLPTPERIAGIIVAPKFFKTPRVQFSPKIPMVVINRSGEQVMLPSRKCFDLRFDHDYEGLQVADHLLKNGHRHIALFCHTSSKWPWVQARIAALRSVYSGSDCSAPLSMTIYQGDRPSATPGLRTGLRRYVARILEAPFSEKVFAGSDLFSNLYRTVESTVNLVRLCESTAPLFSNASNRKEITAWVGINDEIAVCAYEFLRKHMDSSPQPQLLGFDNTTNAALCHISSFDSGYAEMGQLAVECISNPDQVRRTLGSTVFVRGNLVRRGSDRIS